MLNLSNIDREQGLACGTERDMFLIRESEILSPETHRVSSTPGCELSCISNTI